MHHDIKSLKLFSLRVQICLLSLVEFLCFVCRNDAVWFLFSKSDACWRQFPLSRHVFFGRQLQVFVSFVLVLYAVSLMYLDEFEMRLLWLSMICLVLFMQL